MIIGCTLAQRPEWKEKAEGKVAQFGMRDHRSIKDQRESLPIYKLRDQLIEAVNGNQVLLWMVKPGQGCDDSRIGNAFYKSSRPSKGIMPAVPLS